MFSPLKLWMSAALIFVILSACIFTNGTTTSGKTNPLAEKIIGNWATRGAKYQNTDLFDTLRINKNGTYNLNVLALSIMTMNVSGKWKIADSSFITDQDTCFSNSQLMAAFCPQSDTYSINLTGDSMWTLELISTTQLYKLKDSVTP